MVDAFRETGVQMRKVLIGAVLAAMTMTATVAEAKPGDDGAVEETGELRGAPYEIRVPEEWNGTLLVYAHGYRDAADHPGEVDDRSADAFIDDETEDAMLAAGYALAGSAYASNGWAVADGIADTRQLVNYFRARIGKPERVILVGFSMGSVVAFESIERYTGVYDGAIPACAVGAGAPRAFDGTMVIAAAYDAVFGWPAAWGTPGDVVDDLDFETDVLPVLIAQLTAPGGQHGSSSSGASLASRRVRSGRSRSGSSPPKAEPSSSAGQAAPWSRTSTTRTTSAARTVRIWRPSDWTRTSSTRGWRTMQRDPLRCALVAPVTTSSGSPTTPAGSGVRC